MATTIRMLPLNALRSFDAAARHLSFPAAAAELGVTPAAVSVQVRRLEEWVGTSLFVRAHRSIALSKTGLTLAPRLTSLFREMERLVSEVAQVGATALRVSAMPSFASKWLAPRLASFAGRHPEFSVRVEAGDRRAEFDADGVDVRLRYGHGDYGDLQVDLIAKGVAFPVCSPGLAAECEGDPQRLDPARLLHDESSLMDPGLPTWSAWLAQAQVPIDPEPTGILFGNSHMALSAAIAGQGFALALAPLVEDDLAAGRLVRPFAGEVRSPFDFWFVCQKDRLAEPKIAAFRSWILEQAGLELDANRPNGS